MDRTVIARFAHTSNPVYFGGAVLFKNGDGSYSMEATKDADRDECEEDDDGDLDCPTTELYGIVLDQEHYDWIDANLRKEVASYSNTARFMFKIKAEEKNMRLLASFFNSLIESDSDYLGAFTLLDEVITKDELFERWEL